MRHVFITAGPVGGSLDPNKLVTNRCRGIWALAFARYLVRQNMGRDYYVNLLVPDTMQGVEALTEVEFGPHDIVRPTILRHSGYEDYRSKCQTLARVCEAGVMAAAVVNWLPTEPYPLKGKMPTHGHQPGDVIQIPFMLMPRVIEDMKQVNPKLTLIGCKLLAGVSDEELVEAAYSGVLLSSRCNVVLANDLTSLKRKTLVYPDRSTFVYDGDFRKLFEDLKAVIEDEHYNTNWVETPYSVAESGTEFDEIVAKYRDRFIQRSAGSDRVFGALFMPTGDIALGICSPREKGLGFTAADAVVIGKIEGRTLHSIGRNKASLNAPLLVRVADKYKGAVAVLHLHEQLPGVPTVPYAPPGTVRDSDRDIPCPAFNIEGHGFVACLGEDLEIKTGGW